MLNIFKLGETLADTDLTVAQMALDAISLSFRDTKFLGGAFLGPKDEPIPTSIPAIGVISARANTLHDTYMFTGTMTVTEGTVLPCIVLVASTSQSSLTDTLTANLDRLATVLGFTDGDGTPLWVYPKVVNIPIASNDTATTFKILNVDGSFDTTIADYPGTYVQLSNFSIGDNRSKCTPTPEAIVYSVGDDVAIQHTDAKFIRRLYVSEKQYLADMQNAKGIANFVLSNMGSLSPTTGLIARVSALETTIATEVGQPTVDAINDAVEGASTTAADAISGLALSLSALNTAVDTQVSSPTAAAISEAINSESQIRAADISSLSLDVNDQLASKADKTEVDDALALKADASSLTNLALDVSAIETSIATEVSPPTAAAISEAVGAESVALNDSISILALATSKIPVLAAKLEVVADTVKPLDSYLPRI